MIKELFKHIACFFVGIDRDVTKTILEACDVNTRSGITNLIDRFLLSIGTNNELEMHQLVQEMGRFAVRQESVNKPWEWSRVWCHEESFRVLKRKKGKENLLGLALDMRMLEKENNIESFVGYINPKRLEKRQKLDGSWFKGKTFLGSLKILNLSFCKQLRSLGEFDQLPALERRVGPNSWESGIQMFYQFGIFSTIYERVLNMSISHPPLFNLEF
ncbi:unnamed protein product [Lactuca virosa]|uniref:Disease resistance protein Roq1-like winged-helix domain-containing protein n=1 Tax=Lactuca virosa TaxID=75947 RepID=A0AAU9NSP5_9ASTR|nr:unnamed protein product [Lactuca virosa]